MKVLPSGPDLHSADFNENIALKLIRSFIDVCENKHLAVEGITNPCACRWKAFHDLLLAGGLLTRQRRELRVSRFAARRLLAAQRFEPSMCAGTMRPDEMNLQRPTACFQ